MAKSGLAGLVSRYEADADTPYTIAVSVRGVRPILFNRMDIDAYDEGGPGKTRKPRTRPEYESMVWRDDAGNLALPTQHLIASIIHASRYFKSPIANNGSARNTVLDALVPGFELGSFGVANWDDIDFRHAKYADVKGSPKPTYRPRLEPGWSFSTQISVVTPELYSPALILELLTKAGIVSGIGDGRKIGMGRFVLSGHSVEDGLPWT